MIWHREDANGDGDFVDGGDARWWHLTDTQFSTVAILDDGANLQERVKYDALSGGGKALHHRWRDPRKDGDRDYDSADRTIIINIAFGPTNQIGQASYRAEADLDRDGDVDTADLAIANTSYESALAPGVLSDSTVKNTIGWDGYVFNPETTHSGGGGGLYTVRFRVYSTELGRWLTRDPAGYVDGMSLYEGVRARPIQMQDPFGLDCSDPVEPKLLHYYAYEAEYLGSDPEISPNYTLVRVKRSVDCRKIDQSISVPVKDFLDAWLEDRPGIHPGLIESIKGTALMGCKGLSCINTGTLDFMPNLTQCYHSRTLAERELQRMKDECVCNGKYTFDGRPAAPVLFAATFGGPFTQNKDWTYNNPLSLEDWSFEVNTPPTQSVGFNFMFYDEASKCWLHANRGFAGDNYNDSDMEVVITPSDSWIGGPIEGLWGQNTIYCVDCNDNKLHDYPSPCISK